MLIKPISFLFLLMGLNSIFAQLDGNNTFSFLNTTTDARQIALGGKILTLIDDVDQPKWNPATINIDLDRKLSLNYTNYLADIAIGSISYAHRFNRHSQVVHTNITYVNYGSLIQADEDGNETGTFGASDVGLSFGYAYHIPRTKIYLGTNTRFIYSSIANFSSSAFSVDFGAVYHHFSSPLILSVVLRNIGIQLSTFNGKSEKLPFEIAIGGSYRLKNVPIRLYGTIDNLQQWNISTPNPSNTITDLEGNTTEEKISFLDNAFRHLIIGAELFPKSAVNLRIGYNFRRGKELQIQNIRTFGGISFGFGLRMNKIKLNYAYSKYHSATNVSTFGLIIDFDKDN